MVIRSASDMERMVPIHFTIYTWNQQPTNILLRQQSAIRLTPMCASQPQFEVLRRYGRHRLLHASSNLVHAIHIASFAKTHKELVQLDKYVV